MQKVLVIAALKPGAGQKARELVAAGPGFSPADVDLSRHDVFVSSDFVGFLFESTSVEVTLHDLLDNPLLIGEFGKWGPLLDGPPRLCPMAYTWQRGSLEPTR